VIEVFDHCGVLIYTTTVGPFSEDTVLDPFNLTISSLQAIVSGTVTACEGEPSAATYAVIVQDDFTNVIPLEADNTFATNIFYCEEGDEITVGAVDPINQLASANSVFTVEGNVNVGNLELCEESISQHLYAEYGDQVFNYNETASTLDSLIYSTQTLIQNGAPDIVIYAGITLDWDTGSVVEFTLEYQEGNPLKNASLTIPTSGFKAEGEVNIQKVAQGGQEYITATGTLTNVTVTDENAGLAKYKKMSYTKEIFSLDNVLEKSVEPLVLSNFDAEELMKSIYALPLKYKQVIGLYAIEGYSHKEIAEMLNIKPSTSRSTYSRAKVLLQKSIKPNKMVV